MPEKDLRNQIDKLLEECLSQIRALGRNPLKYTEKLALKRKCEKRLSLVPLPAADDRPVPLVVKADGSEKPDRIVFPLGSLRPGAYVVRYKVLAADGHITEGALRFTVLEPK